VDRKRLELNLIRVHVQLKLIAKVAECLLGLLNISSIQWRYANVFGSVHLTHWLVHKHLEIRLFTGCVLIHQVKLLVQLAHYKPQIELTDDLQSKEISLCKIIRGSQILDKVWLIFSFDLHLGTRFGNCWLLVGIVSVTVLSHYSVGNIFNLCWLLIQGF